MSSNSDLDLTEPDDMLKDWYLGGDCIDALETNNPPVELSALSELHNPVFGFWSRVARMPT